MKNLIVNLIIAVFFIVSPDFNLLSRENIMSDFNPVKSEKKCFYRMPDFEYEHEIFSYGNDERQKIYIYRNLNSFSYQDNMKYVAFNIAGGGWRNHGSKWPDNELPSHSVFLLEKGFIIASIDFRPTGPDNRFPAPITDCEKAAKLVIEKYNPTKKYGWGHSAGGHLILMLANKGYLDAVSAWSAPSNLATMPKFWKNCFGDYFSTELVITSSPYYLLTFDHPPTQLIHGKCDLLIPYDQSKKLYRKMVDLKIESSLISVKNADHVFDPVDLNKTVIPSENELNKIAADYAFTQVLPEIRDPEITGFKKINSQLWLISISVINISWESNDNENVDFYRIYRKMKSNKDNKYICIADNFTDSTFQDWFYNKNPEDYSYRVTAIDKNGVESRW